MRDSRVSSTSDYARTQPLREMCKVGVRHSSRQQSHRPTDSYFTNGTYKHPDALTLKRLLNRQKAGRQVHSHTYPPIHKHARAHTHTQIFESCCRSLGLSRAGSLIVACKAGTLNGALLAVGQKRKLKSLISHWQACEFTCFFFFLKSG